VLKTVLSLVALLLFSSWPATAAEQQQCSASGGLTYVCGIANAEDLVAVPQTNWVLSSGMAPGGGIYLVDAERKSGTQIYSDSAEHIRHDKQTYGSCDSPPELASFVTHGLHIRQGKDSHSTLYVVGHGGREAIEVFDVDASKAQPTLTWIGCVPMPDGFAANSVASFNDGSLVTTVLMHPGDTFSDVFSGKPTGAIYQWSPGDSTFELIRGTELPGNNGIEVSLDERELYVVSTGRFTISAFSNSNPSSLLRSTEAMDFGPDNIHMTEDGQLLTAGPSLNDHDCGELDVDNMNLEEFASCPKGFVAATIDPKTMVVTQVASGSPNPTFSNATMALQVGEEIWIGTFAGDRIGIVTPAP
jgi:hypothetical protein